MLYILLGLIAVSLLLLSEEGKSILNLIIIVGFVIGIGYLLFFGFAVAHTLIDRDRVEEIGTLVGFLFGVGILYQIYSIAVVPRYKKFKAYFLNSYPKIYHTIRDLHRGFSMVFSGIFSIRGFAVIIALTLLAIVIWSIYLGVTNY